MARIKDILARKGSAVISISPVSRVVDAAQLMNEHQIGALVVLEGSALVGIISERDMMRRVIAERRDPNRETVGAVMTSPVVTCRPDAKIDDVKMLFRMRRIRHLPVIDDRDRLAGMVSIGDLNAWQLNDQLVEIQYLYEYLHGAA